MTPKFLRSLGVGLAWAVCGAFAHAADAPRPNLVIILADDQAWGDLSATGNTQVSTPAVDSLARISRLVISMTENRKDLELFVTQTTKRGDKKAQIKKFIKILILIVVKRLK
jgi:hypothetical protein